MVAEAGLPVHVPAVSRGRSMHRTVELADQPGIGVEQVGDTEEPAITVEDGHVDKWPRQTGVELPDEAQPGLVGRPAGVVREVKATPDQGNTSPSVATRDVRPHASDRHELGRRHHVDCHDGVAQGAGAPRLVEEGTGHDGATNSAQHAHVAWVQSLAAEADRRVGSDVALRPDGERNGQQGAVGVGPLEVRRTLPPARRPAGNRTTVRKPQGTARGFAVRAPRRGSSSERTTRANLPANVARPPNLGSGHRSPMDRSARDEPGPAPRARMGTRAASQDDARSPDRVLGPIHSSGSAHFAGFGRRETCETCGTTAQTVARRAE